MEELYIGRRIFPDSVRILQDDLHQLLEGDTSPEAAFLRGKRIHNNLERSAERASIQIETDTTYPSFKQTRDKSGRKRYRKLRRELLENHRASWEYALETVGETQTFTPLDLTMIGGRMVPGSQVSMQTGFRKSDVKITGSPYNPPHPSIVPREIQRLIEANDRLKGPLERGILAHYHLARIHPFEDGNGRTARIIQDAMMCGEGYFPIPIRLEDRDIYMAILAETDEAYQDGRSNYLMVFSEFLVNKAVEQLEFIKRRARRNSTA
jgi:Fic family protein